MSLLIKAGGKPNRYIVTVGTSGADYDNFDDAIDYLRTLNGGTLILTSDMSITSTAVKNISHITIEGDRFYSGTRRINKAANGGYWYGRDVVFKNVWFYRMDDAGANEIFVFTEDFQDVVLQWVNCLGMAAPPVFDCNGKEAHVVGEWAAMLGHEGLGYCAFSNPSTLVAHLYRRSSIHMPYQMDALWYDASVTITGSPTFATPDHPVMLDKASAIENDSSVSGGTVKDALETLVP